MSAVRARHRPPAKQSTIDHPAGLSRFRPRLRPELHDSRRRLAAPACAATGRATCCDCSEHGSAESAIDGNGDAGDVEPHRRPQEMPQRRRTRPPCLAPARISPPGFRPRSPRARRHGQRIQASNFSVRSVAKRPGRSRLTVTPSAPLHRRASLPSRPTPHATHWTRRDPAIGSRTLVEDTAMMRPQRCARMAGRQCAAILIWLDSMA